ncbi:MAG: hypothetical protein IJW38_00295 [Clostridia bacterium]|nr:hypothetical protein [Clostridia bacterium]
MKKTFYTELAYVLGILILAIGTAFMERASFGMSMIVAPAYILHVKLSEYWTFFSFGMAEYCIQALLLIVIMIIGRKFKIAYLFSFITAVIYGFALDGAILLIDLIAAVGIAFRIACFTFGMLLCAIGVSLLFRPYIPPEAYEVFVKEISAKCKLGISKFKTVYDLSSLAVSLILSFLLFGFGQFVGISWGTFVCAVLNGFLIGLMTKLFDKLFVFRDAFDFRKNFE